MSHDFPVIDIAAVRQPQVSAAARFEIARQVASACEEIGFFAVTGHGRTAAMSITGKSWLIWLTL